MTRNEQSIEQPGAGRIEGLRLRDAAARPVRLAAVESFLRPTENRNEPETTRRQEQLAQRATLLEEAGQLHRIQETLGLTAVTQYLMDKGATVKEIAQKTAMYFTPQQLEQPTGSVDRPATT